MSALAESAESRHEQADDSRRLLPPAGSAPSLAAHQGRYGPLPALRGESAALIAAVEASGLRGRGGAGFPTARKLAAVAAGRNAVVVANGVEGEPASHKDALLLRINPQLVLDGAVAAAAAVGAARIIVAVARGSSAAASVASAIAARAESGERIPIELAEAPARFVTGEETALVQWLNGRPAKPAFVPPRPYERGVGGRPTLVQNVETLAGIALIARFGPAWFRALGSAEEPGTVLLTLTGAVARAGVAEVESGTSLRAVLGPLDNLPARPQAVLVGGYFGTWISAAGALDAPLCAAGLRPYGATPGTRSLAVLPHTSCGLVETARVAAYLARESAGQCGPCVFGLAAMTAAMDSIARCDGSARDAVLRLRRLSPQITGRGACAHPNGATRLVESALAVFADELGHHLAGHCTARPGPALLPIPAASEVWR
ncbi:MAG TPA: NADH-ubiquinone oxidoreductase-F iron-sulfur binding region domain-containing protein [Gaiellales bacterium]